MHSLVTFSHLTETWQPLIHTYTHGEEEKTTLHSSHSFSLSFSLQSLLPVLGQRREYKAKQRVVSRESWVLSPESVIYLGSRVERPKAKKTRDCDFDTWKKSDALQRFTLVHHIHIERETQRHKFGWPMQFYWTHSWTWKTTVCVTYHPFYHARRVNSCVKWGKKLFSTFALSLSLFYTCSAPLFLFSLFLLFLLVCICYRNSHSVFYSPLLYFQVSHCLTLCVSFIATKWTWIDAKDENFIDWVSTLHLDYFSSSSLMSFRTFLASPASFSLSP